METKTFINCTPHAIVMNNGTIYEPSGNIARVSSSFTEADADGICKVVYGDLENVPQPKDGVYYIVSAMVLAAAKDRNDLVAPATGHPLCVRENGRIVSVPCFVQ